MRINSTKGLVTAVGLLALSGAVALPEAKQQACPPACGLDIELPADTAKAPEIPATQRTILVIRGAAMSAEVKDRRGRPDKAATTLVFRKAGAGEVGEPHTPFVDRPGPNGKPITEVRLRAHGTTRLFIREDDAHSCFEEPGCKYDIVNDGENERPKLDPWIIIDR